ncbi:MAG: response regulator [Kamptonema sp. SIO4C4]|nr:response regulator [Kamptonema sp. SIO4C4]
MAKNKVLIIEDNHNVRMALRAMLPGGKFEVVDALDGKAALVAIKDEHPYLRLMVIKYNLPEINGWKIVQKAQEHPKLQHIPTVVIAEADDPVEETLAPYLDHISFVKHPLERKPFQKAIKHAVKKAESPRQSPPKAKQEATAKTKKASAAAKTPPKAKQEPTPSQTPPKAKQEPSPSQTPPKAKQEPSPSQTPPEPEKPPVADTEDAIPLTPPPRSQSRQLTP